MENQLMFRYEKYEYYIRLVQTIRDILYKFFEIDSIKLKYSLNNLYYYVIKAPSNKPSLEIWSCHAHF